MQRCHHGVLRDLAHNGIDHPPNSDRDIPAQDNHLQFNIDTTISLLEPSKTTNAPDIATALVGGKLLRTRLSVAHVPHAGGMRDAVPTPVIEPIVASFVF